MDPSRDSGLNIPTASVTFLFADTEGSPQLWEQHPEAMKVALAQHNSILRQARCEFCAINEALHDRS